MNLEHYQVIKAPPTVFYIPEFITTEEEKSILEHVNSAPKPKWTQLSNRRLQNWGGVPHPKGMIPEKIPEWLMQYTQRIGLLGLFEENKCPNHVLVNEYMPGQGIMPHTDGPVFYPTITTISCGSHTVLDFYHPRSEQSDTMGPKLLSLLLEQRSLLVVRDDMYHDYMHAIAEVSRDVVTGDEANLELCGCRYEQEQCLERGTRVSLTIRLVPNTSRFQLRLGR
ncbi:alpha-ketoglutarate-dependent dioxygenase alkB homolog 6 isoform X1 [Bacillus rossius redtenbacheri]|uniref:alpha-ketoglutarate-dependent dioxygenase alkB homolog 6 isoform X1 n=1 Tax=Bacillus rossius redtenbacheri TaxID=93214 RepID=UPI002FDD21AA